MTEAPNQQSVIFCDKLEMIKRKTSDDKWEKRDHGTIKVLLSETSKHSFINVSHYQTGRSVLSANIVGTTKVDTHNENKKVVVAHLVDEANYAHLVRIFLLYFKTADSAARFVEIVSKESAVDRDRAEWKACVKRQGVTDTIIEVTSDSNDSGDGYGDADGDRKVAHANDVDSGKCAEVIDEKKLVPRHDDDVGDDDDDDDDDLPPVDLGSMFETQDWPDYCPKSYF